MAILPYGKESTKPFNGTINANNDTALQSSVNESIERKIGSDAVNNMNLESQTTITADEKPVKNLTNVFRDIDAKKIQSNTKDIEDESTNILQSRRNTQTDSSTSSFSGGSSSNSNGNGNNNGNINRNTNSNGGSSSTTTTVMPTTKRAPNPILSSVNDAATTEQTNLPQTDQSNIANFEAEAMPSKRHRRHRQQR